jgi:polyphosphate kinase
VELAVPIEAPELQAELLDMLERAFADNQNSWELNADGSWLRRAPEGGEAPRSLQRELAEGYGVRAREQSPASDREPAGALDQRAVAEGSASSAALSSSTDW